jgi:uncharacterized protein YbjT (DUF2867 family)
MAEKKIITIFGATGTQGGSLARAILSDPGSEFAVRAVTRDPDSDQARQLARLGAELVQADIDNPAEIRKALEGAYGAYFVTFFWAHFSPEKELSQARNLAEAARETGIQHAIWSTLEDTREYIPLEDQSMPTLQGKYKVPHFDAKGAADKFFTELGVPVTFFRVSFYWENFIYFGQGPKRGEDGKLYLSLPIGDVKMAGIAAEDIGKCAYGIFKKGKALHGKTIGVAGDQLTGREMAAGFSKALGTGVTYNEITPETYRNFGFPGADDMGNMYQFYRDFEVVNEVRNVDFSRELNPGLKSFGQWLSENADKIPVD